MDMNPLVTVASFSSLEAAVAVKGYLEDRGIPAFVPDVIEPQRDWDGPTPFSLPLNNIPVQVTASCEERASRFISDFFRTT
ncbi:hypothetical protein SAMN05444156_2769 [Verrucomicrobium sp. GAS474]|uniref:hypothetical protein n=1 Tax=Verrucomicrobium sp. GAS474 TaxID=1882831 RepID=UPI00087DB073|nr:hypothetical protein [Verrucomicrobium sp. GAS474]SDU23523.1 hypothetical protein SAMN05444156_2769 [Verrucomicrobium sp. GAS474]